MYFDEDNIYFDDYKSINIDNITFNRDEKLYSYEEGFNKGNLFPKLYSKYKNYVYNLKVSSDKDKLLLQIQAHSFALKDLNLYLDTNPEDKQMLMEFNKVNRKLEDLKGEYERKYGPLCVNSNISTKQWSWNNNPWPWDKGGK